MLISFLANGNPVILWDADALFIRPMNDLLNYVNGIMAGNACYDLAFMPETCYSDNVDESGGRSAYMINAGFMVLAPTRKAIKFLQSALEISQLGGVIDQDAMQYVLVGKTQSGKIIPKLLSRIPTARDLGLRWTFLPDQLFANGHGLKLKCFSLEDIKNSSYVFHANGIHPQSAKYAIFSDIANISSGNM